MKKYLKIYFKIVAIFVPKFIVLAYSLYIGGSVPFYIRRQRELGP